MNSLRCLLKCIECWSLYSVFQQAKWNDKLPLLLRLLVDVCVLPFTFLLDLVPKVFAFEIDSLSILFLKQSMSQQQQQQS